LRGSGDSAALHAHAVMLRDHEHQLQSFHARLEEFHTMHGPVLQLSDDQ